MYEHRTMDVGCDRGEDFFHEHDLELIARKRADLDRLRATVAKLVAAAGGMKCPRCDGPMQEVEVSHVKVDRCTRCGGVFLDRGELDILTQAKSGGLLKRLFQRVDAISPT
jgi:hypothetical protein